MSRHSHLFDFTYEKKPVEIQREAWSGDAVRGLTCPHCGSEYLHHYGFTDYERGEDAKVENIVDCGSVLFDEKGQRSSVFDRTGCSPGLIEGSLQVFSDLHGDHNPSSRRHGIVIKFWCEGCGNISLLCIAQHKGCSYIHWRAVKVAPKNKKRKTIKPKLRFDILKRDNHTCQACGATPHDGATLEIDHIQPLSKGGTDDPDNLQVLCRECNSGKGAR